jgi:hypothetical protein
VNFPYVSPDGKRVAFFDLSAGDLSGGRIFTLAAAPVASFERLPPLPNAKEPFFPTGWSPDGTKIAGQTWGRDKPLFYVDSIAEHSYRPIPGDFGLGNGDEGAKWIDNHRLLLGTGLRIVVFDPANQPRARPRPARLGLPVAERPLAHDAAETHGRGRVGVDAGRRAVRLRRASQPRRRLGNRAPWLYCASDGLL